MNKKLLAWGKRALALGGLSLLLAGCVVNINHNDGKGHDDHHKADPANPQVTIKDGRISVNQDPLVFKKAQGAVLIVWRLPEGSRYTFPENGIVIDNGREEFSCKLGEKRNEFACLNRNSHPGKYKYTIRALSDGKLLEPFDPFVVNDW
jgi:hypothetical protein